MSLGEEMANPLLAVLDAANHFNDTETDAREAIGTVRSICDSYEKALDLMEGLLDGHVTVDEIRAFLTREGR